MPGLPLLVATEKGVTASERVQEREDLSTWEESRALCWLRLVLLFS